MNAWKVQLVSLVSKSFQNCSMPFLLVWNDIWKCQSCRAKYICWLKPSWHTNIWNLANKDLYLYIEHFLMLIKISREMYSDVMIWNVFKWNGTRNARASFSSNKAKILFPIKAMRLLEKYFSNGDKTKSPPDSFSFLPRSSNNVLPTLFAIVDIYFSCWRPFYICP